MSGTTEMGWRHASIAVAALVALLGHLGVPLAGLERFLEVTITDQRGRSVGVIRVVAGSRV